MLIQTYDRHLELLWMQENAHGNYETPVGISENGSVLCINNPTSLVAYDNISGNRLWQIDGRILNNNPLVTKRFIAMAQIGHNSHVFITAKDGSLLNHFTTESLFFESRLPFLQTWEGKIHLTTHRSGMSIIEIKEESGSCSIIFHRLE
ncbi:MAG: hypothetical protein ACE5IR_07680 [bacterium]